MSIRIKNIALFVKEHRVIYVMLYPFVLLRRLILELRRRNLKNNGRFYDSCLEIVEGGSLIVKLPDFMGSFEMDFRSHLLKRVLVNKCFEPDIVELVKDHVDPQKDVLDIGANVGLYTILFSKIINEESKILAVEPTPLALGYLRKNLQRNDCGQSVIIYEGIASDAKGISRINVIPGMEEFSSVGKLVHPYIAKKDSVSMEVNGDTIDNLVRDYKLKPGFIKIDVEGGEYLVLAGAVNTVEAYRPKIIFELVENMLRSCGADPQMVIKLLDNYGYRYVATSDGFLALPE